MGRRRTGSASASTPAAALPEEERAFQKAMRSAALREQSSAGLMRKLTAAGYSAEASEHAIERARACSAVDDARYAEALVRSALSAGKGLGQVRRELEGLGIDLEEVRAYQDHLEDDACSEEQRALEALRRRPPRAKQKLPAAYRFLIGKGYSADVASAAARLWFEEECSAEAS